MCNADFCLRNVPYNVVICVRCPTKEELFAMAYDVCVMKCWICYKIAYKV